MVILAKGNLKRFDRSLVAKTLCGILPLEIETGCLKRMWDPNFKKYVRIPVEKRICTLCKSGAGENEYHFLFACQRL